jgi:hypothetical protein
MIEGQTLTLKAEVEGGEGPFHYLWFKDFVPLVGATYAQISFESIRVSDAGIYWVTVFNDAGAVTSVPEIIRVRAAAFSSDVTEPSRLANVSIVAFAPDRVRVDFTLGGNGTSGTTALLARASGPSLSQFGVASALSDPVLTLFDEGEVITSNDDWGGDASLSTTAAAVGAFPFQASSKDSAVVLELSGSRYSAEITDGSNGTGVTMVELYDTSSGNTWTTPRLINVSARGVTGAADATLAAGFTIQGGSPVMVLLRGLGPSLDRLGITGAVSDANLSLFRGQTLITSNGSWSDTAPAAIEAAQAAVGAFPLDAMSLDSALLVSLSPGSYTAHVSSVSGAGVAQIEVYEVP